MAYTSATIVQKDPPGPDDRVRIVVLFEGNAGEEAYKKEIYIDARTTQESLNAMARAVADGLEQRKAIADTVVELEKIDLTPPVPPSPSPASVWARKVHRFRILDSLGLKETAAVTDVEALRADIDATYESAFLAEL